MKPIRFRNSAKVTRRGGTGIAVGVAVGVGAGSGVEAAVGIGVGAGIGVEFAVGTGAGIGVSVAPAFTTGACVAVGLGIGEGVGSAEHPPRNHDEERHADAQPTREGFRHHHFLSNESVTSCLPPIMHQRPSASVAAHVRAERERFTTIQRCQGANNRRFRVVPMYEYD